MLYPITININFQLYTTTTTTTQKTRIRTANTFSQPNSARFAKSCRSHIWNLWSIRSCWFIPADRENTIYSLHNIYIVRLRSSWKGCACVCVSVCCTYGHPMDIYGGYVWYVCELLAPLRCECVVIRVRVTRIAICHRSEQCRTYAASQPLDYTMKGSWGAIIERPVLCVTRLVVDFLKQEPYFDHQITGRKICFVMPESSRCNNHKSLVAVENWIERMPRKTNDHINEDSFEDYNSSHYYYFLS